MAVVIRRDEGTALVDVNKPWEGKMPDMKDYPAKMVIVQFRTKRIDGKTIRQGDREGVVDLKSTMIVPTDKDLIVEDPGPNETVWSIVHADPVYIGSAPASVTLQLRG